MKKVCLMLVSISAFLRLVSCTGEHFPAGVASGGEVEVEMNIVTAPLQRTRATDPDEKKIDSLRALVFDASSAATEDEAVFLYSRHAWAKSQEVYRMLLKTGNNLNICLAANVGDSVFSGLTEGMTYAEVRNALILSDPKAIVKNKIPMWGIVLQQSISESDTYTGIGKVELLRSVASADIEITDNAFEFTKAYIVSATNMGYLAHRAADVDANGKINAPSVPEGAHYDFGNTATWSYAPENNKIAHKFYMFENDATAVSALVKDATPFKRFTRMIVEGKYNNSVTPTYYPLAFRNTNGDKVQAARNRKFEITVTKVNGSGFSSFDEAIDAEDSMMEYEVIEWDNGYRDSDIIINGSEYISFPGGKTVVLAGQAGSDALCRFSTNALVWDGETLLPGNFGWSFNHSGVEVSDNPITNSRFSVMMIQDGADASGESCYLKVTAHKAYSDETGNAHTATLSIRIGRIRFEVALRQVENGWIDGGNQEIDLQ